MARPYVAAYKSRLSTNQNPDYDEAECSRAKLALDVPKDAASNTTQIDTVDSSDAGSTFNAEVRYAQILSVVEASLGSRWSEIDSILREPCKMMFSDDELRDTFARLKDIEPALSGRSKVELVRPSGSLASRVGIKLHYPTFCTAQVKDGESADFDSPCSRILLRKGLTPKLWFWNERSCRREQRMDKKISPIDTYERDVAAQHEQFEVWCDRNAAMKIQLICGAHNWKNLRRRETNLNEKQVLFRREDLDLQEDLTVTLCWSKSRVYILAYHPEWFLHAVSGPAGQAYDLQINTAVALANLHAEERITVDSTYFERLGLQGNNSETNSLLSRKNAESDYAGIRQYADDKRASLRNEERASIEVRKDKPIKIQCMSCKGRGVTTVVIDQQPTYMTEGQHIGKYVAKRRVCQAKGCCPPFEKNPSRRRVAQFNPLDLSIICINDGEIGRKRAKNSGSKDITEASKSKRKLENEQDHKITLFLSNPRHLG